MASRDGHDPDHGADNRPHRRRVRDPSEGRELGGDSGLAGGSPHGQRHKDNPRTGRAGRSLPDQHCHRTERASGTNRRTTGPGSPPTRSGAKSREKAPGRTARTPGASQARTIAGLDPGAVYQIRVTARNGGGRSPWSPVLEARTQDLPAPDRPGKADPCRKHHHRTERAVERTGEQRVQDQRVHRPLPETGRYGMDRPPSFGERRPALTLPSLDPGTVYEIRVKARNAERRQSVVPGP